MTQLSLFDPRPRWEIPRAEKEEDDEKIYARVDKGTLFDRLDLPQRATGDK